MIEQENEAMVNLGKAASAANQNPDYDPTLLVEMDQKIRELIARCNGLKKLCGRAAKHMAWHAPDPAPFDQPLWQELNAAANRKDFGDEWQTDAGDAAGDCPK